MDITVRKASPATIQMIGENGDSINVTEEVISTVEETTDKTDELITKQSVLDVFNKQVIERVNLLPKYSKDYFYINTGDPETTRNTNIHSQFFDNLGFNFTSGEYGIMTMHDYVHLDQFQDREGDITFDDITNTFSNVLENLSRLIKYKIVIMKGSRKYSEREVYAVRNHGWQNTFDIGSVRNSIVGTTDFNNVCKGWYNRIIEHAEGTGIRLEYEYRIPDPNPNQDGAKLLKKGSFNGRVDLSLSNRQNTNTVSYGVIFGEGRTAAYFLLPKVNRNLRGFKIRKSQNQHAHRLYFSGFVYNTRSNAIVSEYHEREVNARAPEDTILFDQNITLSDRPTDDLILWFHIRTSGDDGDAMGLVIEIVEFIYDDNYSVVPELNILQPSSETITNELEGPDYYYAELQRVAAVNYRYTVKNFTFKPKYIITVLEGSERDRAVHDGIEVYRNGQLIGKSANSRLVNEVRETISNPSVRYRSVYRNKWNYDYNPYLFNDVSNIDIRNGDIIVFKFQFYDAIYNDKNLALSTAYKKNYRLKIMEVLGKLELIG